MTELAPHVVYGTTLSVEAQREIMRRPPEVVEDRIEIPPPEFPAQVLTNHAALPQSPRLLARRAAEFGFEVVVTGAKGPRLDQYNKVVEQSRSIKVIGRHPDGRRFVAHWIEKTGERGKKAGVKEWKRDFAYARWLVGRVSAEVLDAYCLPPVDSAYLVTPN